MRTVDAIAEILKREGIDHLICFPTTPLIEAVAEAGIRPIICRQERVGVGIADGYARVKNGRPPGVFAMQSGPGAENAFAGIATAFSDATPMLRAKRATEDGDAALIEFITSEELSVSYPRPFG